MDFQILLPSTGLFGCKNGWEASFWKWKTSLDPNDFSPPCDEAWGGLVLLLIENTGRTDKLIHMENNLETLCYKETEKYVHAT